MYRVGRGEQGVLTTPPYTKAILPLWRFRTPKLARASARAILRKYRAYRKVGDFAGMDMCRKFLQMGYTRSRRYARHRGGRKYGPDGLELPEAFDAEKQRSAEIFKAAWDAVRRDRVYQRMKTAHLKAQREGLSPTSVKRRA